MSDYLVNLVRRSAGIAPVARPRSGPDSGPVARVVRGVERPPPSSSPVRGGPVAGQHASEAPGNRRSLGVAPMLDEPARTHGATSVVRESEPTGRDTPRPLRIVDRAAAVEHVADAPTATITPAKPTPTVTGPVSPFPTHSTIVDHTPDARRDPDQARNRPTVDPRREVVTVEHRPPASPDGARRTDAPRTTPIEPALAPAPLGRPPTRIEDRGPGREVHVRIGTIEIHADPAAAVPTSLLPTATPAVAALPQGGFDEFVRLRTYAPWER